MKDNDTDLARADPRLVAGTAVVLTTVLLFVLLATQVLVPSAQFNIYLGLAVVAPLVLFGVASVLAVEAEVLHSRAEDATASDATMSRSRTRRSAQRLASWAMAALIIGGISLTLVVLLVGATPAAVR